MDDPKLLTEEREILRHTLGLDRSKVAYRNFFTAAEDHADWPILERLVAKRFMFKSAVGGIPGFIFQATVAGREWAAQGGDHAMQQGEEG